MSSAIYELPLCSMLWDTSVNSFGAMLIPVAYLDR